MTKEEFLDIYRALPPDLKGVYRKMEAGHDYVELLTIIETLQTVHEDELERTRAREMEARFGPC